MRRTSSRLTKQAKGTAMAPKPVSTTRGQVPKTDPILEEQTPTKIEVGVDQSTVDQTIENVDVKCSSKPRNSTDGLAQVEEDNGVPIIVAQDDAHDENERVQPPIIADVKSSSEPREDAECQSHVEEEANIANQSQGQECLGHVE
ncbi:hypothetical protein L7F22_013217, partial [Adiantum nelumboides]|nr:hypothetical protein [Adiantum nelumboides]